MNSWQCWKAKLESALFSRVQSGKITVWGDLLGARNQKVFTERKYSHMSGCHIANTMD